MVKAKRPKMSLLEYICHRELGPPVYVGGSPYWACPVHGGDSAKFYLSENAKGKVRYHCWSHGCWGDETDLLKAIYGPGYKWQQKRDIYRVELERDPKHFLPKGCTMVASIKTQQDKATWAAQQGMGEAVAEWFNLIKSPFSLTCAAGQEVDVMALRIAFELTEIAKRHNVSHEALLTDIAGFYKWCRDVDVNHMAECEDDECEWLCCVAKREEEDSSLKLLLN